MNTTIWIAIAGGLAWVAAAIRKVAQSGQAITLKAVLKEIFTFN